MFTAEEVLEQLFQDDFGQGDSDVGDIDIGEDDNEQVPSSDSEWEYEEENLPPPQTLDLNLLSSVAAMSSTITEEVEEVNDSNASLADDSMVNNFGILPLVSPTTIDNITTSDVDDVSHSYSAVDDEYIVMPSTPCKRARGIPPLVRSGIRRHGRGIMPMQRKKVCVRGGKRHVEKPLLPLETNDDDVDDSMILNSLLESVGNEIPFVQNNPVDLENNVPVFSSPSDDEEMNIPVPSATRARDGVRGRGGLRQRGGRRARGLHMCGSSSAQHLTWESTIDFVPVNIPFNEIEGVKCRLPDNPGPMILVICILLLIFTKYLLRRQTDMHTNIYVTTRGSYIMGKSYRK